MNKLVVSLLLGLAVAGCCDECCKSCAKKATEAVAVSPDGHNEISLTLNPLTYTVKRDGVVLVRKSAIGLTVDGVSLTGGVAKVSAETLSGSVASPVYKKAKVDLSARTAFADFGDWGVRVIARNDGVAYRFETRRAGEITINAERAQIALPAANARCWANYNGAFGQEESITKALKASELKTNPDEKVENWMGNRMIYLPFVYEMAGKTVAVTEAGVRDYPIWDLTRDTAGAEVTLESLFAAWPKETMRCETSPDWKSKIKLPSGGRWVYVLSRENYLVKTAGTRSFPWRVFILADAPAKLCESDIAFALAAPQEAGTDFSWVKPGKVAWDWWNCFDNSDPAKTKNKGCTTKTYERFIDFAAKNGVEYVIFDEGWSEKLNIWKFHPEVDVPHLIDYANKKGVGIILWMAWAQAYGNEEKVASHFAKLGAKGFKVDFMDRGDAEVGRFLEKFAAACAKEKMVVDYHGVYRPNGLHRKYPNVLNYEGVHGLEQMKWHDSSYDFMANDIRVFFCRMTAGPMDYTPGAMNNFTKGTYKGGTFNPGSYGTRCRQMAMMALFEAPLQMLCDSPTNYEKNLESFAFMAATPVVWANTVGLAGDPDSFCVLARQAKDGAWYVAGMTDWTAREYAFDAAVLGAGEWKAEIFRDAPDCDKDARLFVHEKRTVKAGEKLALPMAPGGGFIMRLAR